MTEDSDQREGHAGTPAKNPKKDPARNPGKDSRRDRLKLALRENLKRRKSQARGRRDVTTTSSQGDNVSPHDESKK